MIRFTVIGEPVPQPRAKAARIGGFVRIYTPSTANDWKNRVIAAVQPYLPPEPLNSPLRMSVRFMFPRPAGHFGSGKKSATLKDSAPPRPSGKPDLDNALKAVMDALTDAGVWRDDCRVCDLVVSKVYADRPGAEIEIEEVAA